MLRICFLLLVLLLPCGVSHACPTGDGCSAGDESRNALEQLTDQVVYRTLKNGLRVITYRRGTAPVFAGAVAVRVGGTDETAGQTGIAHMLEHMAFKGTPVIGTKDFTKEKPLLEELEKLVLRADRSGKLLPPDQSRWDSIQAELRTLWTDESFTREYEKRGSQGMNATTDSELTRYFVNLPSSSFEFWCWMESERIAHPVMRQFYQERDVVMEERRMRFDDDPGGKLYETLLGVAFVQHPYRNPVIGYPDDLRRLTATMIEKFHRAYYVPANMVVSVVGQVSDHDLTLIDKYFGRIPAGDVPARPDVVEPPQEGERRVSYDASAQPQLVVAYRKPNYPHPDDPPISVMSEIFAGSSISPAYEDLVKRRKVATGIDTQDAPGAAYPNLLLFSIGTKTPHTNHDALSAFDQSLATFLARGATAEQLEIAKRAIAVQTLSRFESNSSLALDFATSELLYHDWKAMLTWYDLVSKVSVADVERVARQYLVKSQRTVGVVEPAANAHPAIQKR